MLLRNTTKFITNAFRYVVGSFEVKRALGTPGHQWKLILEKQSENMGTGFVWLRAGTSDGLL
jgi:hypothetical protein